MYLMKPIDYDNALNAEQRAAVMAPDGPVLVIAAAGTGKTRTLIYRVAHLLERGVPADRILLLTFTNRAAAEMLERAQGLVGEQVGGLWGGTFHHMANRVLRRNARRLGYGSDYTILDQEDAKRLVRDCSESLGLLGKHFPKPDVLLSIFGLASSTERSVIDIANERYKFFELNVADIGRVRDLYQDKKRKLNAMDFDDLLCNALELFRQHPDVLEMYQKRFTHILVDEYQDTNVIQAEWVDILAARNRNLLVVGDDFQSIYSWRGANYRNILTFPERYDGTTIFKLETNYRSLPGILDVANACIAGNPEQFQKELRPVRMGKSKPCVMQLRDGRVQAKYVIEQVQALCRQGISPSEICILYRAHFHALELQLELAHQKMPFVITSGVRFFEQAHIKDVCALPRLIANPADELAFRRLLEFLPRVGRKTAAKIWKAMGYHFDPGHAQGRSNLLKQLPGPARERWKAVHEMLDKETSELRKIHPGHIVEEFVKAFYGDYIVETYENFPRRLEDIQELITFSSRFVSLDEFLSELALLTNVDTEADRRQEANREAIRLSTVHQAKGLEWQCVFILWMVEGMFPSGRSVEDAGGASEERRLFYVASTRAKDALFLCMPQMRRTRDGGVQYCAPSRFIEEIPHELVKQESGRFY